MRIAFIFAFILVASSLSAQVYTRNYEVKSGDKRVGEIKAVLHSEGEIQQYDITSDVYMTLLFTIHVSYKVEANFKNGVLLSSSATVYINDKVQNKVDIERTGDHYTVQMDGHTTRIYEEITYSSAKLYFSRPSEIKNVLSETNGVLKRLTETSDGKFRLKDPENESAVNTYAYSSEQGLNTILIERSLFPDLKVSYVREAREIETKDIEE